MVNRKSRNLNRQSRRSEMAALVDSNPIAESRSLIGRTNRKVAGKAKAIKAVNMAGISSRDLRDRIEQERVDVQ